MEAFLTTNYGCLSLEDGIRAVTAQLNNQKKWKSLRLLSLPPSAGGVDKRPSRGHLFKNYPQ